MDHGGIKLGVAGRRGRLAGTTLHIIQSVRGVAASVFPVDADPIPARGDEDSF